MAKDSIHVTRTVEAAIEEAFELFTEGFGSWYPPEYSWSGEVLEYICIEAGVDGSCFELGPEGFRCDWGRVLEWEPPQRLLFTWQISFERIPVPDPSRASEIEVVWRPQDDKSTHFDFRHHHLSRHGERWEQYREAMASEQGWPYILDRYVNEANGR